MTLPPQDRRAPRQDGGTAGGVLVALGAMIGAAVGFMLGEATPGFLVGLGLGSLAALFIWWRSRR